MSSSSNLLMSNSSISSSSIADSNNLLKHQIEQLYYSPMISSKELCNDEDEIPIFKIHQDPNEVKASKHNLLLDIPSALLFTLLFDHFSFPEIPKTLSKHFHTSLQKDPHYIKTKTAIEKGKENMSVVMAWNEKTSFKHINAFNLTYTLGMLPFMRIVEIAQLFSPDFQNCASNVYPLRINLLLSPHIMQTIIDHPSLFLPILRANIQFRNYQAIFSPPVINAIANNMIKFDPKQNAFFLYNEFLIPSQFYDLPNLFTKESLLLAKKLSEEKQLPQSNDWKPENLTLFFNPFCQEAIKQNLMTEEEVRTCTAIPNLRALLSENGLFLLKTIPQFTLDLALTLILRS